MKQLPLKLPLLLPALAGIIGLALASGWFNPSPVSGHANLARSEPAANSVLEETPQRVVIWFTEPLEPRFSQIQVLNSQAQRVDQGDSAVDANDPTVMSVSLQPLPDGTYTVSWRNLSTVDGHTVRSSFFFSVGEPPSGALPLGDIPAQPVLESPAEPVLRWLILLGALAMVGGLGFELLISRPALSRPNASQNLRRLPDQLARRSTKFLGAAAVLLLLASLGQLLGQAAKVHDLPFYQTLGSPVGSVLFDTGWGHLWLWRIGLLLGLTATIGLSVFLTSKRAAGRESSFSADLASRILALALGAAMLLTFSLASHGAATAEVRTAAIFSDYAHLLAAAFWVGGLFQLALALPLVRHYLPRSQQPGTLTAIIPRFSVLAVISVGTLIITGLYNAWVQVTVLPAVATPYGWTLLVKVVLVGFLLVLGAGNLLWIRPRLGRQVQASQWLRRLVAGEVALALLVLLAVGTLASMEPARQVASRLGLGQPTGLTFQDTVEGANISLLIEPGQVGPNKLLVSLRDRRGEPITNASEVRVDLVYLGSDLGENSKVAQATGEGQYLLENEVISLAGDWQAELVVRRPDAFDARTAFRFETTGGVAASGEIIPSADLGKLLWGVELVLLGVLLTVVAIPIGGLARRRGAIAMGAGLAAFFAGVVLAVNTQTFSPGEAENLRNPFPPTPESLAIGQEVYAGNCLACHGALGRGDGPQSAGLDPPPADLVVHVPLHFEQALYDFIENGIPGTAMAPLGDRLTEDEIWHVINYIKTLE
ncbi:MAG: copper resistance protein CopC [Dehalococcoidia bacterium]